MGCSISGPETRTRKMFPRAPSNTLVSGCTCTVPLGARLYTNRVPSALPCCMHSRTAKDSLDSSLMQLAAWLACFCRSLHVSVVVLVNGTKIGLMLVGTLWRTKAATSTCHEYCTLTSEVVFCHTPSAVRTGGAVVGELVVSFWTVK
jgi:hypothetical protein